MARYQYDASPLSNDLATAINEHSAALDKLIAAGSSVPSVAYADGTLTGVDPVEMTIVIPDHATQDLDFVLPFKGELIDAYVSGGRECHRGVSRDPDEGRRRRVCSPASSLARTRLIA